MRLCNYVENAKDEMELASLMKDKVFNLDTAEKLEQIANTLSENYEPMNLAKKYLEILM